MRSTALGLTLAVVSRNTSQHGRCCSHGWCTPGFTCHSPHLHALKTTGTDAAAAQAAPALPMGALSSDARLTDGKAWVRWGLPIPTGHGRQRHARQVSLPALRCCSPSAHSPSSPPGSQAGLGAQGGDATLVAAEGLAGVQTAGLEVDGHLPQGALNAVKWRPGRWAARHTQLRQQLVRRRGALRKRHPPPGCTSE